LAQKDALRRNPPAVVKPEAISAVAQMPENTIEA